MKFLRIEPTLDSFVKLILFAIAVIIIHRVLPLLGLCVVAILFAIALNPLVTRMQRYIPRPVAISVIVLTILTFIVGFFVLIGPPLASEVRKVIGTAPKWILELKGKIPSDSMFYDFPDQILQNPIQELQNWASPVLNFGQVAVGAFISLLIVGVIVTYLLIDGRKLYAWILAFFTGSTRSRLERTAAEVAPVISSFVIGQMISASLCSVYVFTCLKLLNVPAALVLAALAGVSDVLPMIGFFLTLIPSTIFALTVSSGTALAVIALWALYHGIENYFLLPFIFGSRLSLSGLTVLLSILVGISVAGVTGAIIILPIIASYPIIERIWLTRYFGNGVVQRHERLNQ